MPAACVWGAPPSLRPHTGQGPVRRRGSNDVSVSRDWVADSNVIASHRRALHVANFSKDRIQPEPGIKASKIPDYMEDREVMHDAFVHAFQEAQPEKVRLPGMQEFASGLLARARIPSQQYMDPLAHIFQEFDKDGDGCLRPEELAAALRSRNVSITDEQAAMFIDVVDVTDSHKINQAEFRDLVLHMAAADLHSRRQNHNTADDGAWVTCSWEDDDEIQGRMQSWLDKITLSKE